MLKYTPVTQSILCLTFSTYLRTIQCLNYGGQEPKTQFAVYDSDTPVTLKQGKGHQTWYKIVNPKQVHNNTKIKTPT